MFAWPRSEDRVLGPNLLEVGAIFLFNAIPWRVVMVKRMLLGGVFGGETTAIVGA
jgi:hypothetical protein